MHSCEYCCIGNCAHGSVRLVNSANPNNGTLELCLYTYWGTVSYWAFHTNDAKVVCRMLGYDVDSYTTGDLQKDNYEYL